jgi:DNA end-binding protein Ku
VPKDEVPVKASGKVVNLMDALRKSIVTKETASAKPPKKPAVSVTAKDLGRKGIGLVKASAKSAAKRKSA